jgi:type IV secretion system protein VirD4
MSTSRLYKLPDSSPQNGSGVWIQTIVILLGIVVFAAWCATQYAAHKLGYQASLGQPVTTIGHIKLYEPFSFFIWLWKYGNVQGTEDAWTGGETILASLHFLVIPAIWLSVKRAKKTGGKTDMHGSAHWATHEEINETGLIQDKPTGAYVGAWVDPLSQNMHYLTHDGPEHILVFAPTRSGKGVGLVIPTLLSWRHSALIHDIKGEAWAVTSGFRKALGQKCLKFDPTAMDGSSVKFNPLSEIRLRTDREVSDVQNLATMIVDPDGKGMSGDHWRQTGHALLVGVILHVLYAEDDKTLRGVATYLSNPDRDVVQAMEKMMNTNHIKIEHPDGTKEFRPHPVVAESAREMLNKADNERSGVLSTSMAFLSLYRDPIVAKNTETSEFKIDDLMDHDDPVSLYLVVPPSDKDRLKPLTRLVINQIIRRRTEKMEFEGGRSVASYKHRLLLMIDEFPALGKLEIFEEALAFIAGYGMKAFLITQDLSQLYKAYTKDESIISNCHIRIAYAPNKIETAELLSKMCGTMTVLKQKLNYSGNRLHLMLMNVNASEEETKRELLTADECMRLPGAIKSSDGNQIIEAGDMLIFVAGFSPIYGKQILYFQDQVFDKRSKCPAPAESDRIRLTPKKEQEAQIQPEETIEAPEPVFAPAKITPAPKAAETVQEAIAPIAAIATAQQVADVEAVAEAENELESEPEANNGDEKEEQDTENDLFGGLDF